MLSLLRSRPLAMLAGLWFLVAGREPPFPHPCEMAVGSSVAPQDLGAQQHDSAHDEHAHHGHDEIATPSDSSNEDPPAHTCECVDDCCVSAAQSAVSLALVESARVVPIALVQVRASASRVLGTAPRLLPFANGPPALT